MRNASSFARVVGIGALPFLLAMPIAWGAQAASIDVRVSSEFDDAEESRTGRVNRKSRDLELVDEGTRRPAQIVGMRFRGVAVPRGATILNAYVQFQVDEPDAGHVLLEIRGEATVSSRTFSRVTGDISSRPRTSASVLWAPPPWIRVGQAGPAQRTPNLAPIIREIVLRRDWTPGSAITLIVTGAGERSAKSFDGRPAAAPLLHIDYVASRQATVNRPPKASFTATPTTGFAPLAAWFDASGSADPEGGKLRYHWDFGNGTTGVGSAAAHAYGTPGTYTATLTVTDDLGRSGTARSTVTAFDPAALRPLKVAFIGDQGRRRGARAVLRLIAAEGADMVLHQGDFDYDSNPSGWDAMITEALGADFPYFASVGNHDKGAWGGPGGYQAKLIARLGRVSGARCSGDLGVMSSCIYRGLFFILSGAGTIPKDADNPLHIAYIRDQLAATGLPMRICTWHRNQREMQVGSKPNDVGWGPYEACREGGAIIATAHEHSYSRTHLLDHFESRNIANTSSTLRIEKGKTFAFVSGLGGHGARDQDRDGPWWASIYTSDQRAKVGALFCTFFPGGDPTRAKCYFKDIKGVVPDEFEIISRVAGPA